MSRSWIKVALVSLSLSAVIPAFAFAEDRAEQRSEQTKNKGDGNHEKKFPMNGDTFTQKVNERLSKMQERLTKRLEKRNVPAERRQEATSKFNAGAERVRAAAKAAAADGTVTADEAKAVHKLSKELRGHKAKGKKGGENGNKENQGRGKAAPKAR